MLDGESVRRHPTAYVAPTATLIGEATLGRQSSVWFGTVLRADFAAIKVGEQSNIQDLTVIHADRDHPVLIGPRVSVGHRAILHSCRVESNCLIGMGAILLSRVVVGRGSVVAAGCRAGSRAWSARSWRSASSALARTTSCWPSATERALAELPAATPERQVIS